MSFSADFNWCFLPHFVLRSAGFPFSLLEAFRCPQTYAAASAVGWTDADLQAHADAARALFEREKQRGRAAIVELVSDPAFQEAIYLSSPDFFENNLGKYVKAVGSGQINSDLRRIERRLFSYIQRFAAKNETTSIFGPLNYGDFGPTAGQQACELAYCEDGDGALIRRRSVFLAYWAVKALAAAVSRDPGLAQDLPLRLHPMVQVVPGLGLKLHQTGKDIRLPPALVGLMAGIDGRRSTAQLCRECAAPERVAFHKLIASLLDRGCVQRGPFVSSSELHLLGRLIADVDTLPDSPARRLWLERLQAWQGWCGTMSSAPLSERRMMLRDAEARFTADTGLQARRGQGEMYADRTIFYEEALGNVQRLRFSLSTHDAMCCKLRGALELSAALGHHQWQHLRAEGLALLRRLSPDGRALPFANFIAATQAQIPEFPEAPAPALLQQLEQQVRRQASAGQTRVVDVASSSLHLPEVSHPLYSLPDMFISAADEDALRQGHFDVFLGKLHHHLLVPSWLTTFLPDEAGLRSELRQLLSTKGLDRLVGLEVMRRNKGFYAFTGTRILYAEEPAPDLDVERLFMRDLLVGVDEHGQLRLFAPGWPHLNLYLTLADHARYAPFAMFSLPWLAQVQVSTGEHTPRVLIDGVVIQREHWLLSAQEILATRGADEFSSFMRLTQLCTACGLPQQVYAKGQDRKPIFIDLAIPQCHVLLRAMAEKADTLHVEEMYPGPGGLWLNRAKGGFTCELRANVFKLPTPAAE